MVCLWFDGFCVGLFVRRVFVLIWVFVFLFFCWCLYFGGCCMVGCFLYFFVVVMC